MKKQKNFKISTQTESQIRELVERTGKTQTELISTAIGDLHRATVERDAYYYCPTCATFVEARTWRDHVASHQTNP